ncbi:MAG: hypothetical protein OEW97_01815 [Gammaproteobacteria bacterium]|nr:hypothetical protein [Gammaproteobacteria bacterium]
MTAWMQEVEQRMAQLPSVIRYMTNNLLKGINTSCLIIEEIKLKVAVIFHHQSVD